MRRPRRLSPCSMLTISRAGCETTRNTTGADLSPSDSVPHHKGKQEKFRAFNEKRASAKEMRPRLRECRDPCTVTGGPVSERHGGMTTVAATTGLRTRKAPGCFIRERGTTPCRVISTRTIAWRIKHYAPVR
jgi:hypothetical protein